MLGIIRHRSTIYLTAILISLLLSLWSCVKESVINPDAICYLQSAAMMNLGLGKATHVCSQASWPFYSIIIYALTSMTKMLYINSAYILNAIFSFISVAAFIGIIHFLKGSTRVLWLAAAVILLAHEFNDVRQYIIRDHGYWSFYLLSILFLLHYTRQFSWRYALAWSASLFIATLFRVEGVVFLLFMPCAIGFCTEHNIAARLKAISKLHAITFGLIALLGIWFVLHPHEGLKQFGRLEEIQFRLLHGVSVANTRFQANANALAQHVLNSYSSHDAGLLLFFMVIAWYLMDVISNLTLIYSALVIYAWVKKLLPLQKPVKYVVWGYIVINIAFTSIFLFENMFLSKRYLLALSLTLMIWVPFALDALYQEWQQRKWPLIFACALILVSAAGGIFDFGYSKAYIRQAGQWIEKNVPQQASLYSNDIQLMFYSQHFGGQIFENMNIFKQNHQAIIEGQWKQYEYIALRSGEDDIDNMMKGLGAPIQEFANKRGDKVSIYKIKEQG